MGEDVTAKRGQSPPALGAPEDSSSTESEWQIRCLLPDSEPMSARLSVKYHWGSMKSYGVTSPHGPRIRESFWLPGVATCQSTARWTEL